MKEKIEGKYGLLEEKSIRKKSNNSSTNKINQYKLKMLT